VLAQRGSWRAKARKGEPNALPASVPEPPSGLLAGAKREWERIAPLITAMGHMTAAEVAVLEGYCVYYDAWQTALKATKKFEIGTIERRRVEISAAESYRNMLTAAAKLGLSPADRTKVREIRGKEEIKDKARFFGGPRLAGSA